MQAAKLDTKIVIQKATTTQTAAGEPVESWSEFVTVFASKAPRPGKEFYQAGKVFSESLVFFETRHISGLTTRLRVLCGSEVYDVTDIQYSAKRLESVMLTCKLVA